MSLNKKSVDDVKKEVDTLVSMLRTDADALDKTFGYSNGGGSGLAWATFGAVFVMLSNERKKEFAIMRIMGASQKILFKIMSLEALILSGIGGLIGVMIGVIVSVPLSGLVSNLLSLPFLMPNMTGILMIVLGSLLLSVIAALLPAMISANRMTNSETGLLLREDA